MIGLLNTVVYCLIIGKGKQCARFAEGQTRRNYSQDI